MKTSMIKNRVLFKKVLRIGLAESIASVGDWITMMAVMALLVFRGEGGVAQSSGIFLAGILPMIPAGILAGKLCDRFDRKKLMIASQLLSAAVVSGLIFTENQVLIYILLALEAVTISVMTPARQSSLPILVEKDELTQANALLQQLAALVKIGAPMLAGVVLSVFDPHQAILFNVITFLLSALILRGLPALPPAAAETVDGSAGVKSSGARSVISRIEGLQLLFLTVFCGVFVLIGFDVLSSVYIRDVLGQTERFLGFAIGMIGLGTLLSSGFLLWRRKPSSQWGDMAAGLLLLAVIPFSFWLVMILSSSSIGMLVALAGCLVGGFGNGLLTIQSATLLQTLTPLRSLGQVSGAYQSTLVTGQLLGTVITPLLVPGMAQMTSYFILSTAALVILAGFLILQLKKRENMRLNVSVD